MEPGVYLIDCVDAMKNFEDNFFDLAVVDPPYGINATNFNMGSAPNRSKTDGHGSGSSVCTTKRLKGRLNSGGGKLKNRLLNTSNFEWDNQPPTEEYFNQLFRISKNQIIWGGNYFNLPPTRCIICWDKCQPWENFSQWEMAWTSFDKPAKMYRISNIGGNNKEEKIHPTQKPVKLYDNIFRDFSEPGMKIIDTHLGSGSSRVSAEKGNLIFYGFEINENYLNLHKKRFDDFKRNLTLF